MHQFGYLQGIPRALIIVSPSPLHRRDVDEIFAEYRDHLVPEDVCSVSCPHPWSTTYNYIQWLFRVSHTYLTLNEEGDPLRSTHQKILEEE